MIKKMKHFLRITYNVFEFHWGNIKFGLVIGGIIGMPIYFIFKDAFTAVMAIFGSIAGQIIAAYYKEYKRFKDKGHY